MLLSLCSCLSSTAACSTFLYNSDSHLALSLQLLSQVFVFYFTMVPTASISAESLSTGLEALYSSTYHANFVQPLSQQFVADVTWFFYTTLFGAIFPAFRSWHVSKTHSFFSPLTQPPVWERRKTKLKRGASLLSGKRPRLPKVPMNIIHQSFHRLHHQRRARIQVHLPSFQLLVHVPTSIWCLVHNPSATVDNMHDLGVCIHPKGLKIA